jgi:hypothetical protein
MVIPPTCPGLCVEILVNAQPLQEYDNIDDNHEPPNTVTKYIEAQSAAEFAVRVTIDKNNFLFPAGDIEINTKLDGESVRLLMCSVRSICSPADMIIDRRPLRLQSGTDGFQKFQFTALQIGNILSSSSKAMGINILLTVDGPASGNVKRLRKELQFAGTISVQLRFVENERPQPRTKHGKMVYGEPRTYSQIPESALKGDLRSHHARFAFSPQPVYLHHALTSVIAWVQLCLQSVSTGWTTTTLATSRLPQSTSNIALSVSLHILICPRYYINHII